MVEKLSSIGTLLAKPIPSSIGEGLPALADSHLPLSAAPATSAGLGLSAQTIDAIKKGEFVDFDLPSECFIIQNQAGMGLQMSSSPSHKMSMPQEIIR